MSLNLVACERGLLGLLPTMKLLLIIGPPAVGKMTVGREIAARSGFRLFHNHHTIEPLVEVFGYGTAILVEEQQLHRESHHGVVLEKRHQPTTPDERSGGRDGPPAGRSEGS